MLKGLLGLNGPDKRVGLFSCLKYLKCEMAFLQEIHQLNKNEDLKKDGRAIYFIPILILRHVRRNNKKDLVYCDHCHLRSIRRSHNC